MSSSEDPIAKDERRSKLEIYLDILWVIKQYDERGAKKSNIVYEAKTGWVNIDKHLDFLIGYGFIEKCKEDETYHLSIKGIKAISHYEPLKDMFYPRIIKPEEI